MAKQSKAKKSENLGKGTVTPLQIAFLVNQFLFYNSYTEACFVFRTEASSLFSTSPIQEIQRDVSVDINKKRIIVTPILRLVFCLLACCL
ncbi:nuclear pore complex protein NUP205-like [Rosa sericea]